MLSSGPLEHENENEVSLKPTTSSMIFKPKTPSLLPKSAKPNSNNILDSAPSLLPSQLPPASGKVMQAPILIEKKHNKSSDKSNKKGPTREEVFAKVEAIFQALLAKESTNEALEMWKNASIPNAMTQNALNHLYKVMLEKDNFENTMDFVSQLTKQGNLSGINCNEAYLKMIQQNSMDENKMAKLGALSCHKNILDLKDLAELCRDQNKVFFLSLSQLKNLEDNLKEKFDESGVNLADLVSDESELARVLAEQNLTFLAPLLNIKEEMEANINKKDVANFAKWIGQNVDSKFHAQPDFIMGLFSVVFKFIVEQSEDSGAEKELLGKFRTVLKPFVADKPKLQLAAVYALQMSCNSMGFPKGLLLRSFVNFYEMDIVDEHAFLQWKEDVNETYPGKGKALFQVI